MKSINNINPYFSKAVYFGNYWHKRKQTRADYFNLANENSKDIFISQNQKPISDFEKTVKKFSKIISFGNLKPQEITASFDHGKIFEEEIEPAQYYQKMLDKLKNEKLHLVFNEENVSDDIINQYLNRYSSNSYFSYPDAQHIRQNPNFLHLLNAMSGLEKDNHNKIIFDEIDFSKIDNSITIEDIDDVIKFIKKAVKSDEKNSKKSDILSTDELNNLFKNKKEIFTLSAIAQEVAKRLNIEELSEKYILSLNFDAKNPEKINELYKLIETFQRGTIKNNVFDFECLLEGNRGDNFKKIREFYQSLDNKVVEIVDIRDILSLLNIKNYNSDEVSEILNSIPKERLQVLKGYRLPEYIQYRDSYKIEDIGKLSEEQKRKLLRDLVSISNYILPSGQSMFPFLSLTSEEYCTLLNKLAKSVNISSEKLTQEELVDFNQTILKFSDAIKNVDINNVSFELDFSKKDFIAEIEEKLSGLSDIQKTQITNYFGFLIEKGTLKGYPKINKEENFDEISSSSLKNTKEEIKNTVEKFLSKENRLHITGADEEFSEIINQFFEYFPELKTMVQKEQHPFHAYTLDKHVLKVLQEVCINPEFEKLSFDDKKVLIIASLFHDIAKSEGKSDKSHPVKSAFDAYYIIQRLNLDENQQLKIYELIKTHNWLQILNNASNMRVENLAQDIAFDSRYSNTFELSKILCEADLKGVKEDDSFFEYHKKTFDKMSKKVDSYISILHNSQIILPQTKIPRASELKNCTKKSKDGIENTVLYMDKADYDLSKYGFCEGTTKDNWLALVHALEGVEEMSKFTTFDIIDTEALLSTSYINPYEYQAYKEQGLILDINYNDIHAGFESDFKTGNKKTLDTLKEEYLFPKNRIKRIRAHSRNLDGSRYRTFIPNMIIDALNLTPEEYYKRVEKIQDCRSITDIKQIDKEFADALLDVFKKMHSNKRENNKSYNEILVTRPKIQGVFAYDKDWEDIPKFLRKYAQDNDLPVVIFNNK